MGEQEPTKLIDTLTSRYKTEVLQELIDNPDYTYTVNEMAEDVSGSYNSVRNFLRELERFDIVTFTKKGGSYLIEYNQDSRYHDVITDLLRADNQPLEDAARKYAEKLYTDHDVKSSIRSIVLFGSVARGTAGPDSDIDVLVLTDDNADIDRVENTVQSYAEKQVEIENDVVPVVETATEFAENARAGKRFETNVLNDGIVLKGDEIDVED